MNAPFKIPASVERHVIKDRQQWLDLRKQDVTASAAGALLGVHDYTTAYGLWALKSGKISEDSDESGAMKRGRVLEQVAIQLIKEEHPDWQVTPPEAYFRDPAARLGATPDLFAFNEQGHGIVQIKTVEPGIFRRKWRDQDTGELSPPLWIVVQAIIEAHLTGAKWASVAALVIGFSADLHIVPVPIHQGLIDRIKIAVRDFWERVESGNAPDMDYGRDGAVIAQLYGNTNGTTIDLSADNHLPELLAQDEIHKVAEATAKKGREAIRAEILAKLGSAEAAICAGWKISAKTTQRKAYSVEASSYRAVRATRLQPKE